MAPVLGYWDIRGLAQPIRYLLEYSGQEYEEKRYSSGSPPDFDGSEWFDEKYTLGLEFPNLPYYIDDTEDIKISQNLAIIKLLAKKFNLYGQEKDRMKMDMLEGVNFDMTIKLVMFAYTQTDITKEKLDGILLDVKSTLIKQLSNYLGDKDWLFDQITYLDFLFYEDLSRYTAIDKTILEDFPNLVSYRKRFESMKNIKEYMESPKHITYPYFGPMSILLGAKQKPN